MNKNKTTGTRAWAACLLLAMAGGGCLAVKSEHEVKPIYITMDIHLKLDRELDRYFGEAKLEQSL